MGIEETHGGKHKDIHNLKIFGEFGKNYFTEFGKPYINCAVSDYERPLLQALNSTNSRTKKCFIEWGRSFERLACMAVFMYKGTEEQLKVFFNYLWGEIGRKIVKNEILGGLAWSRGRFSESTGFLLYSWLLKLIFRVFSFKPSRGSLFSDN